MKKLNKPNITVEKILLACAANIMSSDLKSRLEGSLDLVNQAEKNYDIKAESTHLYQIKEELSIGKVTALEMKKLYDGTFVRKSGPTRKIYNQLIQSGSSNGHLCPLCNQRPIKNLDHHLPKAHHPAFAITPYNLVPCCRDCNMDSLARRPQSSNEQTIHPYYHSVDHEIWLKAKVVEGEKSKIVFYADPPDGWSQGYKDIVCGHMIAFDLNNLYSIHSAGELVTLETELDRIHSRLGSQGVIDHLLEKAMDRRKPDKMNNWQAALFAGLATSNWYCSDGFKKWNQ